MIKSENHYSVTSIEFVDSDKTYQLSSKPRDKQFTETKETTYFVITSTL